MSSCFIQTKSFILKANVVVVVVVVVVGHVSGIEKMRSEQSIWV